MLYQLISKHRQVLYDTEKHRQVLHDAEKHRRCIKKNINRLFEGVRIQIDCEYQRIYLA